MSHTRDSWRYRLSYRTRINMMDKQLISLVAEQSPRLRGRCGKGIASRPDTNPRTTD